MRGLANVSIVYCDEASFFDKQSQSEVIDVVEKYAGKSNAKIILCSTPNKVGDLMYTLLQQPWEQSFYKVVKLDYTYSLGKLYTEEDLQRAKASTSFEREYNLSFGHAIGNVFSQSSIDRAVELGSKYPVTINPAAEHVLGCDPGFSSSACAFCVLEYSDDIMKVVYADQFEKASFNDMITKTFELYTTMKINTILIDSANPEYIKAVKMEIGEDADWFHIHEQLERYRNNGWDIMTAMKVVPVSFTQEGAAMLVHAKQLLEFEEPIVAINPQWTKLIAALRGAVGKEYKLDKNESPLHDLTDSFRLAAKYFKIVK
jgi:hypothetical protein